MEKVYPEFEEALIIGKYNEKVIAHEFAYQGIPLVQTVGKNDFDFYLPDGRSLEVKMDIRSQCTGAGAIEWKTIQRHADLYLHTFTYNRLYTWEEYQAQFLRGKKPAEGFGQLDYDARYVWGMGKDGIPGYEFIRSLKTV